MRVLFFDTATRTGWAFVDGAHAEWGAVELRRTGDHVAPFLIQAGCAYRELMARYAPAIVGYEAVLLRPGDAPLKLQKLYGLANEVERQAFNQKIPCVAAGSAEVRAHFLGKGYPRRSAAVKVAVMNRCRARGWAVDGPDEADALAGADYLLALHDKQHALAVAAHFGVTWSPGRV